MSNGVPPIAAAAAVLIFLRRLTVLTVQAVIIYNASSLKSGFHTSVNRIGTGGTRVFAL